MGTRATLLIRNDDGTPLLKIFRMSDGYFYGMGAEIIEFIRHGSLTNSNFPNDLMGEYFGDMGDLACQLIAHFKRPQKNYLGKVVQTPGNFSVIPLDDYNECFHYELGVKDKQLYLKANGYEIRAGYENEGVRGTFDLYPLTMENIQLTGVNILDIKPKKKARVKKT